MPRTRDRSLARACLVLALALGCGERESAPVEVTPAREAAPTAAPAAPNVQADSPEHDPKIPPVPPPLFPRGLVTKEDGATPGYVLFNPLLADTTYLVDNDGRVVHLWKSRYSPGGGIYLLLDGHLLRTARDPDQLGFRSGGTGGILEKLDWDGNVVWQWRLSDEARVLHHDVEPLANGNILAIAWEVKSPEEARRHGRRPDVTPGQGVWPDWVLEIEPIGADEAKIVWEWHVWDHLVQDYDEGAEDYGDPVNRPHRLDVNADAAAPAIDPQELEQLKALGYVPEDATPQDLRSDFLHINAITYHPRLDQIALSVPTLGEVWVIDHGVSTEEAKGPAGDLLYRWGNPGAYGRDGPDSGAKRFFYQHDVRWVPDGWENAGNLIVLNNGRDRPEGRWTSVDEWTPPIDETGRYPIADGDPWGSGELAWRFAAAERESLFAPFISGANRLASGNTLVCDGTGGRFIEVTREGEVVWEYRNPFRGLVPLSDGRPPQPAEDSPFAAFRATRIKAGHSGLTGRDLAPLDPQPEWANEARAGSDASAGEFDRTATASTPSLP